MGAVTVTGKLITEFAGDVKVYTAKIDGQTGSAGTLTLSEATTIHAVQCTLAERPTADCCAAGVYSVASNVITFEMVEGDGTPCTQNALDFYCTVIYS
jgi:hypothetical protein